MISYRPLREYMKINSVSFRQLSNQGLIASTVVTALNNDRPVRLTSLEKVANVFNLSVSQVCEYIEDSE